MQAFCMHQFGEVRAITSVCMYEACLQWIAEQKTAQKLKSIVTIWRNRRNYIAKLANFHGYVPAMFKWEDSEVAKYDVALQVYDTAREIAADTDGKSVNQLRHSLTQSELSAVFKHAMTFRARPCSLLLAFCSVMSQTIARSNQLCMLKKVHVSLYPEQFELPVNPLFGPVQMLQLGDRGNHKVDKLGDMHMAHWIRRTFKPSLQCPVFGLALKVALDARERKGEQYEELYSNCTGALLDDESFHEATQKDAHACVYGRMWVQVPLKTSPFHGVIVSTQS